MLIFRQGVLLHLIVINCLSNLFSSRVVLILMCWDLKECEGKPKINYVTVFERPGLHEFLKQLSEFADLILFTAGLEGLLIT